MVKWGLSAALLLGLLLPQPVRADSASEAKAAFETASSFFALEEFEAALPHFRQAYELSEHRPAATFGLAQCLRSLKQYGEAIEKFEEYLTSNPDDRVEVEKTVRLLRQVHKVEEKRKADEADAQAKDAAARQKLEADIRAKAEAEAKAKYEAEARIRAEEQAKADARRRADLAATGQAPPPPPALVTTPEPEDEDDGGILSSPVFWIVTGLVVAGGAAAGVYFGTRSSVGCYGGGTEVCLEY